MVEFFIMIDEIGESVFIGFLVLENIFVSVL